MSEGLAASGRATLDEIMDDVSRFDLEPPLRASVRDHCENLRRLAASLQTLGLDDVLVDRHVYDVFEDYRQKLLKQVGEHVAPSSKAGRSA